MLDAKRLLDQFLGSETGRRLGEKLGGSIDPSQLRNAADRFGLGGSSVGGAALASGLAGLLLGSKKGRKLGGSALRIGGMALIGALAYKAFRAWQDGQPASGSAPPALEAPPANTPFSPAAEADQQSLGRNLLRAMIAAAKADGHIDASEQARVFAELDKAELDADDKAFVMDELRAPLDIDAVAKAARTPEEAAEIYTASLLAIDVDNAAERGYLALLAARLGLDDKLVEHLHATVEGSTKAAVSS